MLSFCHQARCLSASEFERLADHKRMDHIAGAMVFADLYGWGPVCLLVWQDSVDGMGKGIKVGEKDELSENYI